MCHVVSIAIIQKYYGYILKVTHNIMCSQVLKQVWFFLYKTIFKVSIRMSEKYIRTEYNKILNRLLIM